MIHFTAGKSTCLTVCVCVCVVNSSKCGKKFESHREGLAPPEGIMGQTSRREWCSAKICAAVQRFCAFVTMLAGYTYKCMLHMLLYLHHH